MSGTEVEELEPASDQVRFLAYRLVTDFMASMLRRGPLTENRLVESCTLLLAASLNLMEPAEREAAIDRCQPGARVAIRGAIAAVSTGQEDCS